MLHLRSAFAVALAFCVAIASLPPVLAKGKSGNDSSDGQRVEVGPRPLELVEGMDAGPLKDALEKCSEGPFSRSDFSIGHRGAALQFPEHTRESYEAAARMGAGIIECDVTFTLDRELVCRHSQCDLHTTTNILEVPELAAKCSVPFQPAVVDTATGATLVTARAQCCTSDITLDDFKMLEGKMDTFNPDATSAQAYMSATQRADPHLPSGELMTHAESIELFKRLGVKMAPELKAPSVAMPFAGDYTQARYAQQMIDEYKAAEVAPDQVYVQSFSLDDVLYWIKHEPEFGRQAVYLDDIGSVAEGYPSPSELQALAAQGVNIIAPPLWALLGIGPDNRIIPSSYALDAKAAGLDIITWTLERAGPLESGGGWYHQSVAPAVNNDGDTFEVLDVLAQDVGIIGIFSDWPATVTYYASCKGL